MHVTTADSQLSPVSVLSSTAALSHFYNGLAPEAAQETFETAHSLNTPHLDGFSTAFALGLRTHAAKMLSRLAESRPLKAVAATWLLYQIYNLVKTWKQARVRKIISEKAKAKGISVGIIGAGIGGMSIAKKCIDLGLPFHIYEMADDYTGTWLFNSYPGSGCDVAAHAYSFSWAPNPYWSRKWAKRDELFAHFKHVAKDILKLDSHTSFNSKVKTATFSKGNWLIDVEDVRNGSLTRKNHTFLVSSVGQLNIPTYPSEVRETMDCFKGEQFHSARWRHDIDLTNKRIACIGTGASAIQFAPEVAKVAKELLVFQRSPGWIIAKHDFMYPEYVKTLFAWVPFVRVLYRFYMLALGDLIVWYSIIRNSSPKRSRSNIVIGNAILDDMKARVPSDEVGKQLIPIETPGCKRLLQSDGWLEMFHKNNVKLVCDKVVAVIDDGVRSASGTEYQVDIIIHGTGFETGTFLKGIELFVEEKDGRMVELHRDLWQGIPQAHRGATFDRVPNFVCTYAPNTNVNHTSIISITEAETEHFGQLVEKTILDDKQCFMVRHEAFETYNKMEQAKLATTAFNADCNSWYKRNEFQRIINNWHGSLVGFWLSTAWVRFDEYEFA